MKNNCPLLLRQPLDELRQQQDQGRQDKREAALRENDRALDTSIAFKEKT
jgi:hypothetical protein